MKPPAAVLQVLLQDRPSTTHERIRRTCVASRIAGGWSCVWAGVDGLGVATQLIQDAQLANQGSPSGSAGGPPAETPRALGSYLSGLVACPHCGGAPSSL